MNNNKLIVVLLVLVLLAGGYYLVTSSRHTQEMAGTVTENVQESEVIDDAMTEDGMQGEDAMMDEDMEEESMMGDSMEDDSMMEDSDVKVFEVGGGAFYFDPDEITVTEGDTVRIVFTNEGGTHDWVLDEFNASTPRTQTGETVEVEFVADQAGTFEYYCSVGNHREMGMVGTLVVEPAQ